MLVPTFFPDSGEEDEVLHPDGELARYLIEIASESPPNISQYMIDRAGTNSYFPTSYLHHRTPSPGVPLAITNDNHLEVIDPAPISSFPQPPPSNQTNHIFVSNYTSPHAPSSSVLSPSQGMSNFNTFLCTKFKENPSLNSNQMLKLIKRHAALLSPLSTDVIMLIVLPRHSELFFLHANFEIEHLSISSNRVIQWSEWLQNRRDVTIIEGRIINENCRRYICQDILILNGKQLLLLNEYSYSQRRELLGVWLFDSPLDEHMFIPFVEFVV